MSARTLAGKLVEAFGDVDAMRTLYATDIEWQLPAAFPRQVYMKGLDEVLAHNHQVWTASHSPDCKVKILDEVGDDRVSAVRFTYETAFLGTGLPYQNEYTVFARAREGLITHVFEGLDTAALLDQAQGEKLGHTLTNLRKHVWRK